MNKNVWVFCLATVVYSLSWQAMGFPVSSPLPAPAPTPAPAPAPPAPSPSPFNSGGSSFGPSINPASQQGKSSQDSGSAANAAAGAALMAACMASQPPMLPLCVMGALALKQSSHDSDSSGQSGMTGMASAVNSQGGSPSSNTSPSPSPSPYTPTKGESRFSDPNVRNGLQALTEAGYAIDNNGTVQTPDGRSLPASTFNSAKSMAAAGLDPSAAAMAKKVLDGLNLNASLPAIGSLAADGGGGGGPSPSSSSSYEDSSNKSKNPFAINNNDQKKLMAGKTVMFDGVPIGVRGGDIFQMIHECYQKRKTVANLLMPTLRN